MKNPKTIKKTIQVSMKNIHKMSMKTLKKLISQIP